MKEIIAYCTLMDHLEDCIRKGEKFFDKSECLQTIHEAHQFLKNQEAIFSKIDELKK